MLIATSESRWLGRAGLEIELGAFHGHILRKDPSIRPVSVATVALWYRLKRQLRMREKVARPIRAPAKTRAIVKRSRLLTADRM